MTRYMMDQESREPAVAGMFYPADTARMKQTLDEWFDQHDRPPRVWRGALVPHAGWVYSGRIAAKVFSRIVMPETIVILCPKHRAGGAECAVAPFAEWLIPGGSVAADVALSERLTRDIPELELDAVPHREEHAIEVQLPLLARLAPESRLVGITIGRIDFDKCQAIASGMAAVLQPQLERVLLVISSDMHHFGSDAENRILDQRALEALDELDPQRLYATCHSHHITMCGMLPAVIVLSTLRHLGALQRAERVDYATSAEVSGETQRVVGYAGMLFD